MIKQIVYFMLAVFPVAGFSSNQFTSKDPCPAPQEDLKWRIGGKIHFEEESDADYLGLKEINRLVRNSLKKNIDCKGDPYPENGKLLVKKEGNQIIISQFEEKNRPGIAEEMHATLLYSQSRGFCDSETLKQVCENLFEKHGSPPTIESVASRYGSIINPDWKFEISEAILTNGANGTSFVMLKLLFEEKERLFYDGHPISAGLHMTLINFVDSSLISREDASLLTKEINQALKGKKIKIAEKNGMADLEFGISGSAWRIRAGEYWE